MVTRGMLDSLSVLLGPLAAAGLLAVGGAQAVFMAVAALSLWSAILVRALDYEAPPKLAVDAGGSGVIAEIGDGVRAIAGSRDVALMAALFWAQTFTRGCLMVFSVVVAIDLLHLGESGVGVLNGAVGAGAVLGSLGSALLVGSRRLGGWLALSIALWGLPFVLIAVFPSEAAGAGAAGTCRGGQCRAGRRVLQHHRQAGLRRCPRAGVRRDRERRGVVGRHRRARHPAGDRACRIARSACAARGGLPDVRGARPDAPSLT